jgi:hypothetical protein
LNYFGTAGPGFNGVGTFTSTDIQGNMTTVKITEVSGVPEPASLVLLSSLLVAFGITHKRKLRF